MSFVADGDGGDDDSDREGDGLTDPGGGLPCLPGSPTGGLGPPYGLAAAYGGGLLLGETRLELGYDGEAPELPPRKSNMFLDKPRMPDKNVKVSSV